MDLPALNLDDDSAALTGTLAGALQALTRHTTVSGGKDRGPKEPKTIQEAYKEMYRTLLHFCNVVS